MFFIRSSSFRKVLKLGIVLRLVEHSKTFVKLAKGAEEAGFSHLFLADSPELFREVNVSLAMAASVTSRIKLASCVTNPVTRHWMTTAASMATINEYSGGRAILGIGIGESATRSIGQDPSTLRNLEESIRKIRLFWKGEKITIGPRQVRCRWLADESIPIYVGAGAQATRTLQMAGRLADGVLISQRNGFKTALNTIQRATEESKRRYESIEKWEIIPICLSEERSLAIKILKPIFAGTLIRVPRLVDSLPFDIDKEKLAFAASEIHDIYHAQDWQKAMEICDFIPDELVRMEALAGNAQDMISMIRTLEREGVENLGIRLFFSAKGPDWPEFDQKNYIRTFAEDLIPEFA